MLPVQRNWEKFMDYSNLDLFQGLTETEIKQVCDCFGVTVSRYDKGEGVVYEGERLSHFMVVLEGIAHSYKTDIHGKQFTVSIIGQGGYIGAFLAGDPSRSSPVAVIAQSELTVLFIPFDKIIRQCERSCKAHAKVTANFIAGISAKAMLLFERIGCLIKPTIREKVMAYLAQFGCEQIELPFDREGLAEYLNVERSALSRELSKMKKDSLIDYHKNHFTILFTASSTII